MPETRAFRLAFAALFTLAHSAILRVASVELTGVDYPWYLQCGVANQYVLGTGLQPSVFGVFLITALAAFANGRIVFAGLLAGLACALHATYLLPTAIFVTGFVLKTVMESRHHGPGAFKMLLATCALAVPSAAYTLFVFGSARHNVFAESQHILAEIRIPHHAIIDRWFALPDALQLVWIAAGLVLLRRTRLFPVLLLAAAAGFVLSLLQYSNGNLTMALLFPWRISVVLVPIATAAILARIAALVPSSRAVELMAGVVVLALAAAGAWIMVFGIGYRTNDDERPLLEFVRANAKPGDVYRLS